MKYKDRVVLQIANVLDWTEVEFVPGDFFYVPEQWSYDSYQNGIQEISFTRGITDYEGPWSQAEPGQLIVRAITEELNPKINPQIAYGHKIRVLVDGIVVWAGKIREIDVQYTHQYDEPIITINAFDSLQSLRDFQVSATREVETETLGTKNNLMPTTLASALPEAGFGPWIKFTKPYGWQWGTRFSQVESYYNQFQYDQTYDFSYWWPRVFLIPFTFLKDAEGAYFENEIQPGNFVESPNTQAMRERIHPEAVLPDLNVSYPEGVLDDVRFPYGVTYDQSQSLLAAQGEFPAGFYYQYAEVENTTLPTETPVLIDKAEPWSIRNWHTSNMPNRSYWAFKSQFLPSESTSIVDSLYELEQGEQGFMFTSKNDNLVIVNREAMAHIPELEYDGLGGDRDFSVNFANILNILGLHSFRDMEVSDGISNIVNNVVIENVWYDEESPVNLYDIEDFKQYPADVNVATVDIVGPPTTEDYIRNIGTPIGTQTQAYSGFGLAPRDADNTTRKVLQYRNEESIKRYGERTLNLKTNFAWQLYEVIDGSGGEFIQTFDNSAQPVIKNPDDATSSYNWEYMKITSEDEESLRFGVYDRYGNLISGTEHIFKRNVYAQADELGAFILQNYSEPSPGVIKSLTWSPVEEDEIADAIEADILDKVGVTLYGVISEDQFDFSDQLTIVGMTHRITPDNWDVTYSLWNREGFA